MVVVSGGQGWDRAGGQEGSACAEFGMGQLRMRSCSLLIDVRVCTVPAGVGGKRQLEAQGGLVRPAVHVDRAFQLALRSLHLKGQAGAACERAIHSSCCTSLRMLMRGAVIRTAQQRARALCRACI